MNINISETLSRGLSLLTQSANVTGTQEGHRLNIYMGIGLWSAKDGLSQGLPY